MKNHNSRYGSLASKNSNRSKGWIDPEDLGPDEDPKPIHDE